MRLLLALLLALSFAAPAKATLKAEPSIAYDTLCLLGILSGDPFYVKFYPAERERWWNALPPEAQQAATRIVARFKRDNGITSASLTLWYSTLSPVTLDDVLAAARAPERIVDAMRPLRWWNEDSAASIRETAPDVAVVIEALRKAGFEQYWTTELRPKLQTRAQEIEAAAQGFDPSQMIELALGKKMIKPDITVEVMFYVNPHGISLSQQNYLASPDWPIPITISTALHESLHPPFEKQDPKLWAVLNVLRKDKVLLPRVEHHNKSYGYNTFEGFVEEDCVKALERAMGKRLGLGTDADTEKLFRMSDDGMHVLAPVVYRLLNETNFLDGKESFQTWLIRLVKTGRIAPGKIPPIEGAAWKPVD
ncbi:hypothetical protein [Roseiterribacter gracilis]|uniref:Uncharacterized protein n=1 Tax=Roseiterribacter gracilis TaxID=2812848 RepID=A0A8S8XIU4_9PROT|nr:hypothetical protein TMPK1_34130 [Rhodospirillales bacterium TMPK1]